MTMVAYQRLVALNYILKQSAYLAAYILLGLNICADYSSSLRDGELVCITVLYANNLIHIA